MGWRVCTPDLPWSRLFHWQEGITPDLADSRSYQNASATLHQLIEWKVLPVINENDTVSSAELRFGDNDTLSALVAAAIDADDLILLTDIDRL